MKRGNEPPTLPRAAVPRAASAHPDPEIPAPLPELEPETPAEIPPPLPEAPPDVTPEIPPAPPPEPEFP